MYQGYVDQVREETLELRVINASTLEGSSGTKSMALDVVLSAALTYDVSVTVATVRQHVGGRRIHHQNLTADNGFCAGVWRYGCSWCRLSGAEPNRQNPQGTDFSTLQCHRHRRHGAFSLLFIERCLGVD
jgi:hypothetical protein